MIRIRCHCGEVFHAEEHHVGRVLKCRCGRSIPVRLPPPGGKATHRPKRRRAAGPWGRVVAATWATFGAHRAGRLARWLGWAAWGYAALAGVACAGLWLLAERWWPATVYLFGPRWVVLLPLALLLPAAALLRPRLLLPLLAAAGVVLFPVMGLRSGWRTWIAGEPPTRTLRVVTLNAAGRTWAAERLVARVEEWHPDLVAVQECTRPVGEALARVAGWEHRRDGQLCLLSRHPVREVEVMDRSRFAPVREAGIGGSSAAVRYVVEPFDEPVQLVNLHLETPRKGLAGLFRNRADRMAPNTTMREIESRQVARWAAGRGGPLLLVGDFNLPVESRIYRESWGRYRNAFSRAGRGFGYTRFNGWIRVRIDHVLAGPGWRVDRAFVGPDLGSDHRPVVADLTRTRGD